MRGWVLLLLLAGCSETLPPETYRITVTTPCAECDGGVRTVDFPAPSR